MARVDGLRSVRPDPDQDPERMNILELEGGR
jgi:hypothetical protein